MFGLKRKEHHDCTCGTAPSLKGEPTEVTENIFDTWMTAAEDRDPPIFKEIESILRTFEKREKVKVWTIRRDLKWLRRQAYDRGLDWGKK